MLGTLALAIAIYIAFLWVYPWMVSFAILRGIDRHSLGRNLLIHDRMPNHESNPIPLSIADAVISFCSYDVSQYPLRIRAVMPEGPYWSISFYGMNTENFSVINDLTVRERFGDTIELALVSRHRSYQADPAAIVVRAPSRRGVIIIRMMVSDTQDPQSVAAAQGVQRLAYVEEVRDLPKEVSARKYRAEFNDPMRQFVKIAASIAEIEGFVKETLGQTITLDETMAGEEIELTKRFKLTFYRM